MDFISLYSQHARAQNLLTDHKKEQNIYSQQLIIKLVNTLKRFQNLSIVFLSPQVSSVGKIAKTSNIISFCCTHDSKFSEYQYYFHVQLNLCTNSLKILATIAKQGNIINVYKEGLIQLLSNYTLSVNSLMKNYSLRVHPFTGVAKLAFVNHMTPDHVQKFFKFPVQFSQHIKQHISQMVSRFDQRLLGRILHLTNQISLKNIIPQSFDTNLSEYNLQSLKKIKSVNPLFPEGTLIQLWSVNKKLKDLRKFIANSTIKHQYAHKSSEDMNIRFFPQLSIKRRELEKQQKMVRHNIKILPFSKQVKNILSYFTPINRIYQQQVLYANVGQNSWLQLKNEQIQKVREILKCDALSNSGRIKSSLLIQKIQSQTNLCSGGFANISKVSIKLSKKLPVENPQNTKMIPPRNDKITLVRKSSKMQKLYWQNIVIDHIGKGSCIFINRYYDLKIQPSFLNSIQNQQKNLSDINPNSQMQRNGYTQKMLSDSIFMQYCQQKSLNHYLAKMNSILSIKSKIFLLYQTTIGLRYLRDYGVVHLDMKPQNLLVRMASTQTTNAFVIVKIIDFGQAYGQNLIGKNSKIKNLDQIRGHTCPYAPPQLVCRNSQFKYTQKSDVFSLGVMILMMIFQLNTVDIKRLTSNYVFKTNQRHMKFYSLCIQKCRYIYYEPIIQCLLQVALKCIHPSSESRPYLNWLCVILNNIFNMCDEIEKGFF